MDTGHYPRNKKGDKKLATCKKCGKPHGECADIEAIKKRNFIKKFLEFMED